MALENEQVQSAAFETLRFKIGQKVVLSADVMRWALECDWRGAPDDVRRVYSLKTINTPDVYTVIEQVLQRCHGGVQRLYVLDRPPPGRSIASLPEPALAPWTDIQDLVNKARTEWADMGEDK